MYCIKEEDSSAEMHPYVLYKRRAILHSFLTVYLNSLVTARS